jgi:phosphotriesterase-related protein
VTAERTAMTVAGAIPVSRLGITTMHEHLWMDASPLLAVHGYAPGALADRPWDATIAAEARWTPGVHPDNYRLTDEAAAVDELGPFVAAGGRTIVELTPPSLGRAPDRVRSIAVAAGVQVVQGTGQYLGPTHEAWVAEATDTMLVERLVAEATTGFARTGSRDDPLDVDRATPIRAGIYGEIGTSDPVRPEERRMLRAAATAARATGLAISVHLHPWGHEGATVLDALTAAGADPERVILGHMTTAVDDPIGLRTLADRGAVLGFDLFGFDHSLLGPGRWPPSDHDVGRAIVDLVAAGHAERIVLGQDIGVRTRLRRWGGWGYAHLLEHVVPLLRSLGLSDDALGAMLRRTPARLLGVVA